MEEETAVDMNLEAVREKMMKKNRRRRNLKSSDIRR